MNKKGFMIFDEEDYELPEKIRTEILYLEVGILHKKWFEFGMNEICPHIKEWKIKVLWLYWNSHPSIIKDIVNVNFSELREIRLNGNNIESIEGIHKIKLPSLQEIDISDNFISNIADFNKGNFPNLIGININKNSLNKIQIHKMHIQSLQCILMQTFEYSSLSMNDIRSIVRINALKMKEIHILSQQRILQQHAYRTIKNKWDRIFVQSRQL